MGKAQQHSVGSLPCFMKLVSRMAISDEYPSYMTIPKEFKDQQMDKLSKDVTLKINAAKKWQARIGSVKGDNFAFRGSGWVAFVKDNKLQIGDQITFTMLSGSLFSVRITRAADCNSDAHKPVIEEVKQEPQSEEEGESSPPNKRNAVCQENRQSPVAEKAAEQAREAVVTNGRAKKTAEKQKAGSFNGTVERHAREDETKTAEKTQENGGRVKKRPAENVGRPEAVTQQAQEHVASPKEPTLENPTQQAQQAQKDPPGGKKASKHTLEGNGTQEELVPPKQSRVERQNEPLVEARTPARPPLVEARTPARPQHVEAQTPARPQVVEARTPARPPLVEARTPARPPPLVTNNTDGNDSVTAERHVEKEVPQAHTPLTRARKRAAEQDPQVDHQEVENRNVEREVDHQEAANRNVDVVPECRRKKKRRGTAENPLVIDLSGGAKEAGIHLLLKTESDKEYKLFISASAVQNIAEAQPKNPVGHSESDPENAAAAESNSEPENVAPATNTAAQIPSPDKDKEDDLPSITVKVRTTNVSPYSRMTIEKAFATKWLPAQSCMISVLDSSGTEWPVKWAVGRKRMLTGGWSALVKHHKLEIGNMCTFKVVNPKTLKFSASASSGKAS